MDEFAAEKNAINILLENINDDVFYPPIATVRIHVLCALALSRIIHVVASRRRCEVVNCEHNSELAHDDCRRIRSTIWKLNIAV